MLAKYLYLVIDLKNVVIYISVNAMITWSCYMMSPIGQLGVSYVIDIKPCASVLSEKGVL